MRVSPQDLKISLNKGIEPIYTLIGEESLQIQELVDQICNSAKSEDYLEKTNYIIFYNNPLFVIIASSYNNQIF